MGKKDLESAAIDAEEIKRQAVEAAKKEILRQVQAEQERQKKEQEEKEKKEAIEEKKKQEELAKKYHDEISAAIMAKVKPFDIPKWISTKAGKKAYSNYVLVAYLRRNRELEFFFEPILNEMIKVFDKYYDARADCYFTYGKKRIPAIILSEWSLRPIGTEDYQRAMLTGNVTDAQDISIKAHERMEADVKKTKMNPKVMIIIGLVVAAVIYILTTLKK